MRLQPFLALARLERIVSRVKEDDDPWLLNVQRLQPFSPLCVAASAALEGVHAILAGSGLIEKAPLTLAAWREGVLLRERHPPVNLRHLIFEADASHLRNVIFPRDAGPNKSVLLALNALHLSSRSLGASDFLAVLPSSLSVTLTNAEFSVGLCSRFMVNPRSIPSNQLGLICGCAIDRIQPNATISFAHVLSCMQKGLHIGRHNNLRDMLTY